MRAYKEKFKVYLEDVERYYNFLLYIDSINDIKKEKLTSTNREGREVCFEINTEIQQMLRANFYLVIYNLIEATQQIIVRDLKDVIIDDEIHISKLHSKIHKLYFNGLFDKVTSAEKISRLGMDIMEQSANAKSKVVINKIIFNDISGNLDYDHFKSVISQIGCGGRLTVIEKDLAEAMEKAVKLRNTLAHGNETFSTVGSRIVTSDITIHYTIITTFLKDVINNFEDYINKQKYLKNSK